MSSMGDGTSRTHALECEWQMAEERKSHVPYSLL